MVNRGEEKVRVHMNVVPRSTGNTNFVWHVWISLKFCICIQTAVKSLDTVRNSCIEQTYSNLTKTSTPFIGKLGN